MDYSKLMGKTFNVAKKELRDYGISDYIFIGMDAAVPKKLNKSTTVIMRLNEKSEIIEIVGIKKNRNTRKEDSKKFRPANLKIKK